MIPVGTYQEEKKSLMPFIQVMIGVIIGIAVCFFLIRPTLQKGGGDGGKISDANDQLSVQATKITSLEKERDSLQTELQELKSQVEKNDTEAQKQLVAYESLLKGVNYYINNDKFQAAAAVTKYKKSDFTTGPAKTIYAKIGTIPESEIAALVSQGRNEMYQSYDQAISTFKKVLAVDEDNQEAMVYMARCYQRKNKNKTAKKWYQKAIDENDTTELASQAQRWMSEMAE